MVLGRGRIQREWVLEISFLVSCFLFIDVLHVLLREMQAEEEVVGVEGVLSGLERERNLFYGLGSEEKRVKGKASWKVGEPDRGDDGEFFFFFSFCEVYDFVWLLKFSTF